MVARNKRSLLALALLAMLAVGFTAGFWMPRDDEFFELRKNFRIFGAAYEELVTGYVEPVDASNLMRTGLEAMLEELDPYTTYIDEANNADLSIITRGRYGGVGLSVGMRGGRISVIAPIEGASGYKQGVRAGDIITHIEDQPTASMSLSDVRNLLRGEPGTTVDITVNRTGAVAPLTFTLTREDVKLENVTYSGFVENDTSSGIGYIKLERFTRDAGPEVKRALRTLQQTDTMNGLILDLRDNPGGLLDAAVEVAQLFVEKGSVIVSTRGRSPETERVYRSREAPVAPDLPLVVLVNEYSASASEIVAGAMQDLDRGVIMGSTTFGKGLVQVVRSLPYNTSLKMTTAKYYTPSGRSIQSIDYSAKKSASVPDSSRRTFTTANGRTVHDQHGIEPDLPVDTEPPSELEAALQRRAAFFFFANHYAAEHDTIQSHDAASDETLKAFRTWLGEQDMYYRTEAEQSVMRLKKSLTEAGYQDIHDEIAALQSAVLEEKRAGFDRYASALKQHLKREILARYVSEQQQIEAMMTHDAGIQQAVTLINNASQYHATLTP